MKNFIWAFPGIGKSYIADGKTIIDADYNLFEWMNVEEQNLHSDLQHYVRNPDFPQNYINYVNDVDADIVLINCHMSLLHNFENAILIYPDITLKNEYLTRYQQRGDNESFLSFMTTAYEEMIYALEHMPGRKYKICEKNIFLSDVLNRKEIKNMLMLKNDMIELLQKGKELYNSENYKTANCTVLDDFNLNNISDFNVFAQEIFEGSRVFDFEFFKKEIERAENGIAIELKALERRGGLTHDELADKIMQGIVNGALYIHHGQIAPYSYGYEVSFSEGVLPGQRSFNNRWECYCDFFEIGTTIASKIENGLQNNQVFGKSCETLDINRMLAAIDTKEAERMKSFIPENETNLKRSEGYKRGSIATISDVHTGRGLDGIVKHHYHGDYSSITTCKQNSLVETLVYLNGFCLDYLEHLDIKAEGRAKVVDYLKKHGTDISTPEKLNEWIKNNPEKCALEENRIVSKNLDAMITNAKNRQNKKDSLQDRGKNHDFNDTFSL